MVASEAPDIVEHVRSPAHPPRDDGVVVRWGTVRSRALILGLEIPKLATGWRAPVRVGLGHDPPLPLSAFAPGEVGISKPVLLAVRDGDDAPFGSPEQALASMAGSATVPPHRRLAIYWETYGFAPGDTVALAVWIERHT